MPGTRSQLHVDNSFLPFWLTLLAGRKVFRAVERGHWSPALVDRGVVDDDGDAEFALDWYDDAAVLDAVGGADVYSSVLEPGDSVYIPVAALHGGSNVGDAPALAITGNYHDEAHHAILVDVYCEGKVRRLMRQSKKLTRIRAMVKDPSCLFWAGALGDVEPRAAKESEIPNFKGSFLGRFPLVSADFWTSDHLSERSRSVDAFSGTRARGTLTLKRR